MSDGRKTPEGALTGFKVLDLSRILAGPWCGMLLGYGRRGGQGGVTQGWG